MLKLIVKKLAKRYGWCIVTQEQLTEWTSYVTDIEASALRAVMLKSKSDRQLGFLDGRSAQLRETINAIQGGNLG